MSDNGLREAMIKECQRIDSKYTVYKISWLYCAIIAGIVLIIAIICALPILDWIKWTLSIFLILLILFLGYIILKSAVVSGSQQACFL